MDTNEIHSPTSVPLSTPKHRSSWPRIVACAVALCVLVYLSMVVCGRIKPDERLNAAEMALLVMAGLVVTILLKPNFIERISKFKFHDFEIELERIQQDQQQQKEELDGVRFVLTLLLKAEELEHLRNLQSSNVKNYVGGQPVRAELGKLLDLRLIEKLPGQRLRDIRDNTRFDLGNFVRLTPRGEDFLKRLPNFKPEADY